MTRRRSFRPRREVDRAIALARFRWEILRRTAEYQRDFGEVLRAIAETMGDPWSELRLDEHCRKAELGILLPVSGDGPSSHEHYDKICRRYGLEVLMLPGVHVSNDEMAVFPVFADTPRRQPVVRDQKRLRRVAMRGGDISPRTLRRIFSQKQVDPGPYQVQVGRVRLNQLDSMLAVFDRRSGGKTFIAIAEELGLNIDQVKRAWRRGNSLIKQWIDLDSHYKTCDECQKSIHEQRENYCPVVEAQIGSRPSRSVRSRATPADQLERHHVRHTGEAPARHASKRGPARG